MQLKSGLEHNLRSLDEFLQQNGDVVLRRLTDAAGRQCAVIYCESISDRELLERSVIAQLQQTELTGSLRQACAQATAGAQLEALDDIKQVIKAVVQGNTVLMAQGIPGAVSIELRKLASRGIEEPALDKTILGARDGFNESIKNNLSLVRQRLRTENLRVLTVNVGQAQTRCAVVYYPQAEADARLIETRLKQLNKKAVLTIGDLRPVFAGKAVLFPTVRTSERPDTVCSLLIKGKIALFCDGQPFAICAPITLSELYEASNDAAVAPPLGKMLMLMRMFCSFLAVVLPSLYVSLLTFNRELLPRELVEIVLISEARVPLPLALEVFTVDVLVLIIFEVGISLPTAIGGTIGIFGSILLGQALVEGRVTSEITLFVVVSAAISGYTVPNYPLSSTIKLLRYVVLALAAVFGLAGLGVGIMLIAARLLTLKSLNQPLIGINIHKKPPAYVTAEQFKKGERGA